MNAAQSAEIFKALANQHRVHIVRQLIEKGLRCDDPERCDLSARCCNVGELAAELAIALPTLSYHLKELRRAGLITTQRAGRHLYCSINVDLLQQLFQYVQNPLTTLSI